MTVNPVPVQHSSASHAAPCCQRGYPFSYSQSVLGKQKGGGERKGESKERRQRKRENCGPWGGTAPLLRYLPRPIPTAILSAAAHGEIVPFAQPWCLEGRACRSRGSLFIEHVGDSGLVTCTYISSFPLIPLGFPGLYQLLCIDAHSPE